MLVFGGAKIQIFGINHKFVILSISIFLDSSHLINREEASG